MAKYQFSVKDLIEFYYCEGSISSVFVGRKRGLIGSAIHRKIQKSKSSDYQAEVSLKDTFVEGDFELVISGRADGVELKPDELPLVDEIKSTYGNLDDLSENPVKQHLAQVKIYGLFYLRESGGEAINCQLTYYHVETKKRVEVVNLFTKVDLEAFYKPIYEKYYNWIKQIDVYRDKSKTSLTNFKFPFSNLREGQRKIMVATYKTIENKGAIRLQAPTGIGKTAGVLYPALKTISTGLTDKLFYLTSKGTLSDVAKATIKLFLDKNANFKSIILTAKAKICFNPEVACDAKECIYADEYYTKLNAARNEFFNYPLFDKETIQAIALKHKLCPFELSLDISLWCDLIVCDCNYFYDSKVRLKRFFEVVQKRYVLLCDEAHNLPDRVRGMYSKEIDRQFILDIKRVSKSAPKDIFKVITKINKIMLEIEKQQDEGNTVIAEVDSELKLALGYYLDVMDSWLAKNIPNPAKPDLLELYFYINDFLKLEDVLDTNFVIYYSNEPSKRVVLRIYCLDPAPIISKLTSTILSSIFFSATLEPDEYFEYLLNVEKKENYQLTLDSPFDADNMCILFDSKIDTTYRQRSSYYQLISETIKEIISSYPGNYIIFFPSYKFLNTIRELYVDDDSDRNIISQAPTMNAEERQAVIESFSKMNTILFAISGGFFGEGIDLQGEQLKGCIVVGVSLPSLSFERELIKKYYSNQDKNGFDYAFKFPALLRIVQSAGRLIRTETDTGVLALLDKRFLFPSYKKFLPFNWKNGYIIRERTNITQIIQKWRNYES